jgi:hypothetical protein
MLIAARRLLTLRSPPKCKQRDPCMEQGMIEWFDDLSLGMRFKSGDKLVTRQDIIRFASEFDPQPYHLDDAAAERSPLKGLAASGWHTAAIAMRLAVEIRPFGPHPLLGRRRRLEVAGASTTRRRAAPRRGGDRTHTLKNETTRHCQS